MSILPPTTMRVEANTARSVNRRIERETERRVAFYARNPDGIPERLAELEREWDIERVLEANAAAFGLAGVLLGAFVDKRFLALPVAVTAFLLQHALQGWCPPVPVFRRRGVRTAAEIERERVALKAIRGDFAAVGRASARRGKARRLAGRGRTAAQLVAHAATRSASRRKRESAPAAGH